MEPFKTRLKQGPQYGIFLTAVTWPGLLELLAKNGYDFVVIDTEHGSYSYEQVQALAQRARLLGIHPIVRVAGKQYHLVSRALDMGVDSVMMPTVETTTEVENLVQWAKYPPQGRRGAGNSTIVLEPDKARFIRETNAAGLVVIQIETRGGLENLDALLKVPGLDAIFIGPLDLSISLGIPGEFQHPVFTQAVDEIIRKSRAAGIVVGLMCAPEAAPAYTRMGAHLVAIGADFTLLQSAAQAALTRASSDDRAG